MSPIMLNGTRYLVLKGRAEQIPLRDNSSSLVIATPPYKGAARIAEEDCATRNPSEYERLLRRFLKEATRVVRPHGYILLHTNIPPVARVGNKYEIIFKVFQKRRRRGRWTHRKIASQAFRTHFARVKGIIWLAFPVRLYRALIRRYSAPGDTIVHAFSGSGNGAIAALELSRRPIALDLHHHRQVQRRLTRF